MVTSLRRNAGFILLLSLLVSTTAFSAPLGAIKGSPMSLEAETAIPVDPSPPGNFTAITALPGAIGSVKYSSDGRCIFIVLGGSGTPAMVDGIMRSLDLRQVRSLGKGYFALLMCPSDSVDGGTRVIVANEKGVKRVLSGKAKSSAGTVFVTDWNSPNMLASGVFANKVKAGGANFLTEDYEIAFGTKASGSAYFVIIDRPGNKIMTFSDQGGYFGELDATNKALYHSTIGAQLINQPRIIIAND